MNSPIKEEDFEQATSEIEQELPQMSKLFSSGKSNNQFKSNIKQCQLDLTDVKKNLKSVSKPLFTEGDEVHSKLCSSKKSIVGNTPQEKSSKCVIVTSRNENQL